MDTDQADDTPDPPTGQAGADPDDRETQLLASLSMALTHVGAELEAIRQGLEELSQRSERQWQALKRIDANLGRIAKALEEGEAEANDSSAGF
jgi:hypothetical protein